MPQSSITQITFDQQWFAGDGPDFFDGDAITLSSESLISIPSTDAFFGYPYNIDVPEFPPNPERIESIIELVTQSGEDNGFDFNGHFRPDLNNIVITGNLSTSEKSAVRQLLNPDLGTIQIQGDSGQRIVTDKYSLDSAALSFLGISDFGIIIPYEEESIQTQGNTIQLPFLSLGRTGAARTTEVSLGGGTLTINDGTETVDQSVLLVTNISQAGVRDFSLLNLELNGPLNQMTIDSEEETLDKTIFKVGWNSAFSGNELPIPHTYENNTGQTVELFYGTSTSQQITRERWHISQLQIGLSSGIYFNAMAGSYEGARPTTIFDASAAGAKYAIIKTKGGVVIQRDIVSGNDRRYLISTPDSVSDRTENDVITFSNNSDNINFSVTIEIDGQKRIILNGSDGQGSVFEFEEGNTGFFITLENLALDINDWISQRGSDWNGVSFVINDIDIDIFVSSDYLNSFSQTTINRGGDFGLSYTLPLSRNHNTADNPEFHINLDDVEQQFSTIRDYCDPRKLFLALRDSNLYGPTLGMPIANTDYNGTPDGWLDFSDFYRQLSTSSFITNDGSPSTLFSGINPRRSFSSGGDFYFFPSAIFTVIIDATTFQNEGLSELDSTMQDVCDFFNEKVPFISCSPGLFYGDLTANAFRTIGSSLSTSWGGVYNSFVENDKISLQGGDFIFTNNSGTFNDQRANFNVFDMVKNNTLNLEGTIVNDVSNFISSIYPGLFSLVVSSGNIESTNLKTIPITDLSHNGDDVDFTAESDIPIEKSYILSNFSVSSLVDEINTDWSSRGFVSTIAPEISDRPDAITSSLLNFNINQDLSVQDYFFVGEVSESQSPTPPSSFVYFDYKLNWITDAGTGVDEQGMQVAFGGYKSNGEFFINPSPNAFFEPGFNSLFDVSFTAFEADEIYILVRTREDVDGTTFTSTPNDYNGLVRYSNGLPSVLTGASILTGSPFDAWIDNDWNSGVSPTTFVVPSGANIMTLFADDTNISDSIQIRINNFPSELDEFAFLALNRTNLNASMEESRQGRSFGLVLDNRGIWDVLIGPEAEIQRVLDGEFDYLNFSFNHATIDSDESYNFELFNTDNLDDQVLNSIQLIPVPGFPKVSVLRIESGVRDFLSSTRSDASLNSVDGCSVDIDIIAEGRESGAQGIARVTIFADYTCVFDIGLCDFFWNLTDPPEPQPPTAITNEITISYIDHIDCSRLDAVGDGDNLRLAIPILITADKIPVFENGNALLLVKGSYGPSVEGFFFPPFSSFVGIQNSDCDSVTDNASFSDVVNREVVYINDQTEAIVDPVLISEIINGTEPYLYIKPQFQFPAIDKDFECGANEVVIAAIGYQFRDWSPNVTTRLDDIFIGVNTLISNSTFSAPEIEFCYKYYYRRES